MPSSNAQGSMPARSLSAWRQISERNERKRTAAGNVEDAHYLAPFDDRLPAEQVLHAFDHREDAALAGIGHRPVPIDGEGELLVFGADAELGLRLAARREPGDEFVARRD